MMYVNIDSAKCQGHGICEMLCPEVFVVDDAGYGSVIDENPPSTVWDQVTEAEHNCPESAISVSTSRP
jgi:ferredoxin